MSAIQIRFLHAGRGALRDDIIRIERIPDTASIRVTFTDKSPVDRTDVTELRLTHHSALEYVDTVVHAVQYDNEPPEFLQFILPGFPMVLYTPARLMNHEVRQAIRDMVRMVSESWFNEMNGHNEDTDEDTDEESESTTITSSSSDSTDIEMPPLVSYDSILRYEPEPSSDTLPIPELAPASELL